MKILKYSLRDMIKGFNRRVNFNTILFSLKEYHQIKLENGLDMLLSSKDKGLSFQLFLNGTREENVVEEFTSLLSKDDTVLDIGANLGYYVLIEHEVKNIIAIEPVLSSFILMNKNVQLNNMQNSNVEAVINVLKLSKNDDWVKPD